jgi:hypothetical protein
MPPNIAIGAASTKKMAQESQRSKGAEMPVDQATLEWANWWYDLSGKGLIFSGILAAFAACVTVGFAFIQWRSDLVRERHSDWRTGELEKETTVAKTELSRSQERIAELDKSAEELKAANLALEKQIAPRRLTLDQMNALVGALLPLKGRRVRLESYALDVESALLGKQLLLCLKKAELVIDERGMMSVQTFGRVSLGVHVHGEKQLVDALAKVLSETAGLKVTPNSDPSKKGGPGVVMEAGGEKTPSDATIFIGVKEVTVPVIEAKP